jgi:glycogen debranching enzyme
VSEVAGAEAPHDLGGCPFQAWSLGELLRVELLFEKIATGAIRDAGQPVGAMAR